MNSFQRVIKYCAIAFAVVLAVGIISGIASAVYTVVSAISGDFDDNSKDRIDFEQDFTDVKSLDIENSTGELYIKTGDTFSVEADNVTESFQAKVSGNGKLTVSESSNGFEFLWFHFSHFNNPNSKITVYLPEGFVAESTKINSGTGKVVIDALQTDRLVISAGAGNISGGNITSDDVTIDGGVGNVDLSNVNFTDADMDCGVGNLKIDGVLAGRSKIDCGVGDVNLDLIGKAEDYDFDVDSGVGTIRVNGDKISDSYRNNKGADNSLKIDGGVGSVNIDFSEQSGDF